VSNPFGTNLDNDEEAAAVGLTNEVLTRVEPAVVSAPPTRKRKEVEAPKERRVRIVLEENDGIPPNGQFFGINGVGYLLKPGMQADVPLGIIDVLNNAVQSKPIVDPVTKQVSGFRDGLRFPYRVINPNV
jgi:hypothetical protein